MGNTPNRPLLRYHGGKWAIAPWIISFFPEHRIYVELFGGGGSILLRKSRAHEEIYNDLDADIVNLFMVARDNGKELQRVLRLTPFAREEYVRAYQPADDPLEKARRTVVRAFMGRGSNGATGELSQKGALATGFKSNSDKTGKTAARVWANYPDALEAVIERLRGVVIENRDAMKIIDQHDAPQTLFYADPPYVAATRNNTKEYRYEMTDADHIELAEKLNTVRGAVLVSGYHSDLYEELYKGWARREKNAYADGCLKRTEVLWMKGADLGLFGGEYQ
jgi:DNA adenine methylase